MAEEEAPHASSSSGSAGAAGGKKTVEQLKEEGNLAFKRAQLMQKTTAGKQYLAEAKATYVQALAQLSSDPRHENTLTLACTLNANLAAVCLLEVPPQWAQAKAAADMALSIDAKHVKSLFRRAQAELEDGREGLPESQLRTALADLDAALGLEPGNAQISREAERIRRRVAALEAARRVPEPSEIAGRIPKPLLDRGDDLLDSHRYLWGQTDAIVHVFVPTRGVKLAKSAQVQIEIRPRSLRIALLGTAQAAEAAPVVLELSGALHKPVVPDDSSWQISDGGLLLHVELAKRVLGLDDEDTKRASLGTGQEEEHWLCVWEGHTQTRAPSAAQQIKVRDMAKAACRQEELDGPKEEDKDPKIKEALERMRAACPGINIEWGETDLNAYM